LRKYKGSTSSAFSTIVIDAINDAIEFYQFEPVWFREGEATLTLTVSDPVRIDVFGKLNEIPRSTWALSGFDKIPLLTMKPKAAPLKTSVVVSRL